MYLKLRKKRYLKFREKQKEILFLPLARVPFWLVGPPARAPLPSLSLSLSSGQAPCVSPLFIVFLASMPCRPHRVASAWFLARWGAHRDSLPIPHDLVRSPLSFAAYFFPFCSSFMETRRRSTFPQILTDLELDSSQLRLYPYDWIGVCTQPGSWQPSPPDTSGLMAA